MIRKQFTTGQGTGAGGIGRLLQAVTPSEILVDTIPTLILDATGVTDGHSIFMVNNRNAASIFTMLGLSATVPPAGFAIGNGVEFPTASLILLDDIGGGTLWGIAAAAQAAGVGTRVTGLKSR